MVSERLGQLGPGCEGDAIRFAALFAAWLDSGSLIDCETIKPPAPYTPRLPKQRAYLCIGYTGIQYNGMVVQYHNL